MKLTNYIRDAFIRAVTAELPLMADAKAIKEVAQKKLYDAMSADVRRMYRNNPKALRTAVTWDLGERDRIELVVGDLNMHDVLKDMFDVVSDRNAVKVKIKQVAYGCTTTKQLVEALPEFAHHVPTEPTKIANLPVANSIVADMTKLGWKAKEVANG